MELVKKKYIFYFLLEEEKFFYQDIQKCFEYMATILLNFK